MNVQELRIGNWVLGHSHKMALGYVPAKVTTVGVKRVQLDRANGGEANNIKPIPITEEILLKCGWLWNEDMNAYEKYPNGDGRLDLQRSHVSPCYTMFNYVLKALIAERIYYLHQLQNLYFALTGTELDYTP